MNVSAPGARPSSTRAKRPGPCPDVSVASTPAGVPWHRMTLRCGCWASGCRRGAQRAAGVAGRGADRHARSARDPRRAALGLSGPPPGAAARLGRIHPLARRRSRVPLPGGLPNEPRRVPGDPPVLRGGAGRRIRATHLAGGRLAGRTDRLSSRPPAGTLRPLPARAARRTATPGRSTAGGAAPRPYGVGCACRNPACRGIGWAGTHRNLARRPRRGCSA